MFYSIHFRSGFTVNYPFKSRTLTVIPKVIRKFIYSATIGVYVNSLYRIM